MSILETPPVVLAAERSGDGWRFTRKDGTPYPKR